jgi:hypothetical protein
MVQDMAMMIVMTAMMMVEVTDVSVIWVASHVQPVKNSNVTTMLGTPTSTR